MSFILGIRSLFEKKYLSEYTDAEGNLKRIKISKRQLDELIKRGALEKLITTHILHVARGYYKENWKIEDIGKETFEKFRDEDGDIFASISFENGEPKTMLLKKNIWNELRRKYQEMDEEYKNSDFESSYKEITGGKE